MPNQEMEGNKNIDLESRNQKWEESIIKNSWEVLKFSKWGKIFIKITLFFWSKMTKTFLFKK